MNIIQAVKRIFRHRHDWMFEGFTHRRGHSLGIWYTCTDSKCGVRRDTVAGLHVLEED